MRQMGHMAYIGRKINVHRVSVRPPKVKQPLERPRHRRKNIKMDVGDIRRDRAESDFTGTSNGSL
jgi:hypothetical protein